MADDNKDWREGCHTISDQEGHLLETGARSDCAFRVVGEQEEIFRAHKFVLYRASSVFETMFYGSLPENDVVTVTDIEPEIFKVMLKYVYTDVLPDNLSGQDLMSLCLAANKYLIYNLLQTCIEKLTTKVDVQNLWTILNLADKLDSTVLCKAALKVVGDHAAVVFNNPMFLKISHSTLVAIIKEDNINIASEMEVIDACLRWAKQQCELQGTDQIDGIMRKILGEEIISNMRFLTLSHEKFATGPGMQSWLTAEEKLLIYSELSAPGKLKLLPSICANVTQRNSYMNSVAAFGATNPIMPSGLPSYKINFKRNKNMCSLSQLYQQFYLELLFDADVWVTNITLYTQTRDKNLIKDMPALKAFTIEGSQYLENVEFNIQKYNITGLVNVYSSKIISFTPYESTITHKIEPPLKCSRGLKHIFSVAPRKRGYYPVIDSVPTANNIFRFPSTDVTVSSFYDSNTRKTHSTSPIQTIDLRCDGSNK